MSWLCTQSFFIKEYTGEAKQTVHSLYIVHVVCISVHQSTRWIWQKDIWSLTTSLVYILTHTYKTILGRGSNHGDSDHGDSDHGDEKQWPWWQEAVTMVTVPMVTVPMATRNLSAQDINRCYFENRFNQTLFLCRNSFIIWSWCQRPFS